MSSFHPALVAALVFALGGCGSRGDSSSTTHQGGAGEAANREATTGAGGATSVGADPPGEEAERRAVEVTATGYLPAEIEAHVGRLLILAVTRTSEEGCGDQLVIPSLQLERDLPLNETVEIGITPTESGNIRFTCGMDMYEGKIVVH